ncbi:MFS transporter [Demequina gelatinilytica]|uniref:MFS transporter n=1 Tax=Demequina gelatinilytica TaxID=1638980 RepID=UPI0007856BAB|nr:MFS transporter [Demequina gelatinilytica]
MSGIDRRVHTTLWILASAVFAATLGNMLVPGVLPTFSEETGISIADVGRSNAVFGLAYAAAAPTLAILVRRVSPYTVLIIALALEAVTLVGVAAAGSTEQLAAARIAHAVAAAGVVPMCTVHAGSIVAPSLRSRALSISFGGMVVSSLVGAPLGNTLAGLIGARASFIAVAVLLVVVALVALRASRWQAGLVADAEASHAAGTTSGALGMWAWITLGAVFATAAMEGAATSGLNTFVSPFLTDAVGATGTPLSLLLLCYGIAGLAGNALLGAIADRVGPGRALVLVAAAAAASVAGLMIVDAAWQAAVFLLAWGFCSWAINPPLQALIIGHAGRHLKLLVAVNSSVIFTGSSLGAAVAAAQVDGGGLASLPLTAAALFALSAVGAAVAWLASRKAAASLAVDAHTADVEPSVPPPGA